MVLIVRLASQLVTERDQNLRAAVLKVVEQLCAQLGESRVWDHLGRLDDKQQSLIRERLKFAGKQAAKLATETGRRQEAIGRGADHLEVPTAPPSKMPRSESSAYMYMPIHMAQRHPPVLCT